MKTIFIDGGARVGESIESFITKNPNLLGCDIHLFECNPNHLEKLNNLQFAYPEYNIFVHNEALWNEEGEQDFYFSVDIWGDLGCTLNKNKRERLDLNNPIKVKSMKLSNFLDKLDIEDYIIIKLDIEGAEYEVVKDLLDTNKITMIKELYVEWHDNFFGSDGFESLRERLQEFSNLKYENWNF